MESPNTSEDRGSMLIELCLAMAICSILIVTYASLVFTEQASIISLTKKRQEIFASVSDVERVLSDASQPTSLNQTRENVTPCLERIETSVFELYLADVALAQAVDGDCGLPLTYPAYTFSTSPNFSTLSLESSPAALDVIDDAAFMGTDSSLLTVQTSENSPPAIISSLPLNSRVNALDATRTHVYVATDGPTKQFSVINTEDQRKPHLIAARSLPGVAGSYPHATALFYYNKKVYIGTHRTAGHEFHIFDVSSPNPQWLGSLELNHNVNSIAVREPYVYLATSGNTEDLIVLDVNNPAAPRRISSLALNGKEDAISIYLTGNTLYLGRKKSTRSDHPDLVRIDVENPREPRIRGQLALRRDITGIRAVGSRVVASSKNTTPTLSIIDISDPDKLEIASIITLTESAQALDIEHDKVFLATTRSLQIISFSP